MKFRYTTPNWANVFMGYDLGSFTILAGVVELARVLWLLLGLGFHVNINYSGSLGMTGFILALFGLPFFGAHRSSWPN
ncbi:MAG: hypothetical protein KF760_34365 [Candidatus Eremiobacteraeota bacterium]|nr:hypothetical protein [Candidatus Eremiobacteraeota bacterium]MCW5872907.1 hypothetical protein [Candidatus Eremiobacteraeota bacterium]